MCFVAPCRVTALLSPAEVEVERLGERLRVSTFLLEEPPAIGDWVAVQAQRQAVALLSEDEAVELLTLYEEITRHLEAIPA
jgi:hydrogenase maturation factor